MGRCCHAEERSFLRQDDKRHRDDKQQRDDKQFRE